MVKDLYRGGVSPGEYCELIFKKSEDNGYEIVKDKNGLAGGTGQRVYNIEDYINSDKRVGIITKNESQLAFMMDREQVHYNFSPHSVGL